MFDHLFAYKLYNIWGKRADIAVFLFIIQHFVTYMASHN